MAPSTACTPSLSRGSLRRQSSTIRTGCANERPSGSARGVPREWYPYRDLRTSLLLRGRFDISYFADSISNGRDDSSWETNMIRLCSLILLLSSFHYAYAGDDDSGPIRYSTDLSQRFTTYAMSKKDKAWSESLVKKFRYQGPVVHFVRTSLPLTVDDTIVHGAVYQAVEKADFFYVASGDAML